MIKISLCYALLTQYPSFTCGRLHAKQHSCGLMLCNRPATLGARDIIGDHFATRNESLEICKEQVGKSKTIYKLKKHNCITLKFLRNIF